MALRHGSNTDAKDITAREHAGAAPSVALAQQVGGVSPPIRPPLQPEQGGTLEQRRRRQARSSLAVRAALEAIGAHVGRVARLPRLGRHRRTG